MEEAVGCTSWCGDRVHGQGANHREQLQLDYNQSSGIIYSLFIDYVNVY
jgi:hypothetical protein